MSEIKKTAVKCQDCGQEMNEARSCTFRNIKIDGEIYKRDTDYYDVNDRCHDCNIVNGNGNIHHFGCDIERCPKCGEQIISCDCDKQELIKDSQTVKISAVEKKAGNPVSDYLPDDVESFLQDIAQMVGPIDYTNIWKFRPPVEKEEVVFAEIMSLEEELENLIDEKGLDTSDPKFYEIPEVKERVDKVINIVMKYQVKEASIDSFIKKKGLEPESVWVKDNAKGIVESLAGNEALLVDIPLSKFGKPEFETLTQYEYKPGTKITSPIEVTFTNGEYHITDGANRFSQAVANKDKTIPVVLEIEEGGKYLSGDELVAFYKKISGAMDMSITRKAEELPYIEEADEFATLAIEMAMEKDPELKKRQEEISFSWENSGSDDWYFLFDRPKAEQRDYLPLSGTITLLVDEEVVGTLTFDMVKNPEYNSRESSYEYAVLPENVKFTPEGKKASLDKKADEIDDVVSQLNTLMEEVQKDPDYEPSEMEEGWHSYERVPGQDKIREEFKVWTDVQDGWVSRSRYITLSQAKGILGRFDEGVEASLQKESKVDEELRKWVEIDKDISVIQTKEEDDWYQGTLDKLEDRYELTDDEGNLGEQLKAILEKQVAGEFGKKATGEADQDYDKETFDKIVEQIKAAGFEASHREFDKYQGVYINVKGVDTFWIKEVFYTGQMAEEDKAKPYRSVKLTDPEGNPVAWARGDYFQQPDDTVLEGYTLEMLDVKKGEKVILDSPRIKDLPDITEVMTSFRYKPNTETQHIMFYAEDDALDEFFDVTNSNGKVDASELVGYIKEKANENEKQTKKGANMTYLIRYFDSGEWFEQEEKYETKEAAEKIASDMYVCGVSANIKIADSDGNVVASLGEFADKIALCASCREILENYKGAEDLVKAWHSVDELSHRKVIEAGLEEKVSNAIAEFSSGLTEEAAADLNVVKEAIKEPITPLADALYYLLYWKDGKDLVKACSVMRENKMDTTDVELAGIRLGAGKMKETLTDIGVAVQDIKRFLNKNIEMEV